MKKILQKIDFKVLGVSLLHFLITFITDRNIFVFADNFNYINYICCKGLLLIVLYIIWNFIFKLIRKDSVAKEYFKYFLIYIIPIAILLLLAWPGNWFGTDVSNFYTYTIAGEFLHYLNYISSVFYMIGYMLFPIPSGAIILLVIFHGVVFSYIFKNFMDIYKSKWVYLLLIPFFMLHTLFYTFFANRPIMFGLAYLLLISILVIDKIKNNTLTTKRLLVLVFFTGVVGFWRSESMYLPLAIPLFIFIIYKVKWNFKNIAKIFGLCLLFFVIVSIPQKIQDYKERYYPPNLRNMPIYIGPFSYMLTTGLKGENLEEDLENINVIINIEAAKKYGSYKDTYCIWLGDCLKDYTKEDYEVFKKSYFNVLKNNIPSFLKTKILTFAASTGLFGDMFSTKDLYDDKTNMLFERADTKPFINYKIRKLTYSVLEGKVFDEHSDILYRLTNNLLIPLLFIGLIFIYAIVKKKLFYFLLSGMLLGHTFLVFLTAPASYFMYYYNIYLTGLFLGVIFIIDIIYYKKHKKSYILELNAKKEVNDKVKEPKDNIKKGLKVKKEVTKENLQKEKTKEKDKKRGKKKK